MNLKQRVKDLEKEVDELRFKLEETNKQLIKGFEIIKEIYSGR